MSLEIQSNSNPTEIFADWFQKAEGSGVFDPTEMALATGTKDGEISVRVVLLKKFDDKGFCFFTNYNSNKSKALEDNPNGAVAFHWQAPFHRQVRVQGLVEKMTYEENNKYFQSRPRGSQVAAVASPQSQKISSREELEKLIKDVEDKYGDETIPCPEFWGGWRIRPLRIEFWQSQEFRRHDRFVFTRKSLEDSWSMERVAP